MSVRKTNANSVGCCKCTSLGKKATYPLFLFITKASLSQTLTNGPERLIYQQEKEREGDGERLVCHAERERVLWGEEVQFILLHKRKTRQEMETDR